MLPIIASLISQAMYGAVDTLVVGKFGSDVGLSGVSTGSSIISFVTFTIAALLAFINKLGLEQPSGYGIDNKIVSFAMLILSVLMQSMASFVGQNIGANKIDRAKKAMYVGMGLGSVVGAFICVGLIFFGTEISMIFTDNQGYAFESSEYLIGFALETILTAILFSYMGYFCGQGKTMFVMIQGLAQTFLVRLPMSYIMSIQPNPSLTLIGLAGPSATVFGILINLIYYIIINRKKKVKEIIID